MNEMIENEFKLNYAIRLPLIKNMKKIISINSDKRLSVCAKNHPCGSKTFFPI